MAYLEKLKELKEKSNLTCAEIAKLSNIALPTITKVFNGETSNPGIDTFIRIAIAMGASLDEIAGLKQTETSPISEPIETTLNSYAELLKEKDERIRELKEDKERDHRELTQAWEKERREKYKLAIAFGCFIAFVLLILTIDIMNGHFGYFRY